jgi:hypothetical protein
VEKAGDEGLAGEALFQRALLDSLQVASRDSDIHAAVFLKSLASVADVTAALAPAGFDGAPFAAFGGLQKGLFITVKFESFSS